MGDFTIMMLNISKTLDAQAFEWNSPLGHKSYVPCVENGTVEFPFAHDVKNTQANEYEMLRSMADISATC